MRIIRCFFIFSYFSLFFIYLLDGNRFGILEGGAVRVGYSKVGSTERREI